MLSVITLYACCFPRLSSGTTKGRNPILSNRHVIDPANGVFRQRPNHFKSLWDCIYLVFNGIKIMVSLWNHEKLILLSRTIAIILCYNAYMKMFFSVSMSPYSVRHYIEFMPHWPRYKLPHERVKLTDIYHECYQGWPSEPRLALWC